MFTYWAGLFLFDYSKFLIWTIIIYIILVVLFDHFIYMLPISLLFGINIIMFSYLTTFFYTTEKITKMIYFVINIAYFFVPKIHFWNALPTITMMSYFTDIINDYINFRISDGDAPGDFYVKYRGTLWFAFLYFVIQFLIIVLLLCVMETEVMNEWLYVIVFKIFQCRSNSKREPLDSGNKEKGKSNWDNDAIHANQINQSSWEQWIPNTGLSSSEESNQEKPGVEIPKQMKNIVLHLNDVTVKYKRIFSKDVSGINKINLGLEPNERIALMGLNNSGKSTIIKTIINLLSYEEGSIKFCNYLLPQDFDKIRNNIGYCPEQNSLFPYLTVFETFDYYYKGKLIDIVSRNQTVDNKNNCSWDNLEESHENRDKNIDLWIQTFGLSDYRNVLTMNLSGGNRRKLLFAIALMNNPQLALLDEPSTGVDPDSQRLMWKNLSSLHRKTRALGYNFNWIISTQSIEEAEILSDNLGWLKSGSFAYLGNSENWKIQLSDGYYMKIGITKPSMNDINYNLQIYKNPILKYLDNIAGITAWNIERVKKDKNIEMLYYLLHWDNVFELWAQTKIQIKFVDYIENSFRFVLNIQSNKGFIFSNLLNLKNILRNISELTLSMQPFEAFIDGI